MSEVTKLESPTDALGVVQQQACSALPRWRFMAEVALLSVCVLLFLATIILPAPYFYWSGWVGVTAWLPLELVTRWRMKRGLNLWPNDTSVATASARL